MKKNLRIFFTWLFLLTLALVVSLPAPGQASILPIATTVGGSINEDTVWNLAGSPYEATSIVTVAANVTLTIEPGVVVVFSPNTRLNVNGTLHALGAAGSEISFTGTTSTPGSWNGIWIVSVSDTRSVDNRLEHVLIEYGGGGIADSANLYVNNADVTVRHSEMRNGSGNGLTSKGDSTADVSNAQFTGNVGQAAHFVSAAINPALRHLAATGNGNDVIGIGGAGLPLTGVHIWEEMGLPYLVHNIITVDLNSELYIEPGVEVRFADNARLDVNGTLTAIGTPDMPILFTGESQIPGSWDGLNIKGAGGQTALADFRYATVEYAGAGVYAANVYVTSGRVTIDHSVLRHSLADGLRVTAFSSRSSITGSQIYGNAGYGVRNTDSAYPFVVVASSNWWGATGGPRADNNCNPNATGDRVSTEVVFEPILTAGNANPGAVPVSGAYTISISPRRWYAPANNTQVYVDITVFDGKGSPVAGRQVNLNSTRGQVQIGPATGPDGKVVATISSGTAGTAELTASMGDLDACSTAISETAEITFEPARPEEGYLDAPAPYVARSMKISPLPVVAGTPTRLQIEITNTNDFEVSVDAVFGFAQFGIGQAFGPAGEVYDTLITPGATRTIQVPWTPQLPGHVCIRLQVNIYKITAQTVQSTTLQKIPLTQFVQQHNFDVSPGSSMSGKPTIQTSSFFQTALSDGLAVWNGVTDLASMAGGFISDQLFGNILGFINGGGGGIVCATGGGTECAGWNGPELQLPGGSVGNLGKDPPRQDYTIVAIPENLTYPTLLPGPEMPATRAEAFNNLMAASFDLAAKQWSAVLSFDRYAGASRANDTKWAAVQANAYVQYLDQTAYAMIAYEAVIEALIAELKAEGYLDVVRTSADWEAFQNRLANQGWTDIEIQASAQAGITPEGLELIRLRHLSADPEGMSGSLYDSMQYRADLYGRIGQAILNPPAYGPIGGSKGFAAAFVENLPIGHQLAQVATVEQIIQVGNPLTTTSTVNLHVRPLGMPADWVVTLSETSLVLAPGESQPVTVTIYPGLPLAQATQPGIAVEGFVDGVLIGGVAIDVMVPYYIDYTMAYNIYLPAIIR